MDTANQPDTQIATVTKLGSPFVVRLYNGQSVDAIVPKTFARDICHLSVNDAVMVRLADSAPIQIVSRVDCRYFKRYWDEDCGYGACDGWGPSTFYFESAPDGWVLRQIQFFDDGRFLTYDTDRCDDEFGGLSEAALDFPDFDEHEIDRAEFEARWNPMLGANSSEADR